MASRTIGIFLKMKDGYSGPLNHFRNKAKTTEAQVAGMVMKLDRLGKKIRTTFKESAKKGAISIGGLASIASGFALKTGFQEAFNMEGYKAQLETATKDTKKASEIMRYSIELANKTPFEGGELVEAAAKFESMGMSAKKWLTLTGDMAGATNKSFDQATEALIDAQTGELERLKEFGIKKADIAKKANAMFKGQEVVNNKGQITDLKKFNEALIAVMQERYTGGMDKLSKTIKGRLSTVTGVTKNALATLVGMGSDGIIRQGSAMDLLSKKLESLSKKFTQWQSDGTIDKIAAKVDKFAIKAFQAIDKIGNGLVWAKNNANTLIPIVKTLGGLFAFTYATKKIYGLYRGIKQVQTVFKALRLMGNAKMASNLENLGGPLARLGAENRFIGPLPKKGLGFLGRSKSLVKLFSKSMFSIGMSTTKGTGKALLGLGKLAKGSLRFGRMFRGASALFRLSNPFGWLTLAIEGGILLYQNWNRVKGLFGRLYAKYQSLKNSLKSLPLPAWLKKGVGFLLALLNPIERIKMAISIIKSLVSQIHLPDWLSSLPSLPSKIKSSFSSGRARRGKTSTRKLPHHATGTSYFKGGATYINDIAGDEIAILPSGSKIIPHSIAKSIGQNKNITVKINIQGNVIGEERYINLLGNRISQEIKMAILNRG